MNNKFNIGDFVYGKKTGHLVKSKIAAILDYDAYLSLVNPALVENTKEVWGRHYPDWEDKLVYLCAYESPVRNSTFEEFNKQAELGFFTSDLIKYSSTLDENIKKNLYKIIYEATVSEVKSALYPEDDLQYWGEC